jgi:hypothetical protein
MTEKKCKWCGSELLINKGQYWQCKSCSRYTKKLYKYLELSDYNPKFRPMISRGLKNLPEQPKNNELEREFYIWLSGIISSDGCIYFGVHGGERKYNKFTVTITSVEKDWIDIIKKKSEMFGLVPSIITTGGMYFLRYPNRKVAFLLHHYTNGWLMPRKMEKINEYLKSPVISVIYKAWVDVAKKLGEEIET